MSVEGDKVSVAYYDSGQAECKRKYAVDLDSDSGNCQQIIAMVLLLSWKAPHPKEKHHPISIKEAKKLRS